jgi:hypothetical protein
MTANLTVKGAAQTLQFKDQGSALRSERIGVWIAGRAPRGLIGISFFLRGPQA